MMHHALNKVFFLHDQQEDAEVRKKALEAAGYVVTLGASGDDLLKHLETELPALVLMDVLLKGPNGFEVCRHVRSMLDGGRLPIVLGSGIYRSRIFREEAAAAGAQRFIRYPVDLDELVDIVSEVISISPRAFAV